MHEEDLEGMRISCRLAAECLSMVGENIAPGISTDHINSLVHDWTLARDSLSSPLNYGNPPFPKSCCTSINDVVCHGIPDGTILRDGDIINVDVTLYHKGFHGDTSATFYVGRPSEDARKVTETARKCLQIGIDQVMPGNRIGDIGAAIQGYAESFGYGVVRDCAGHGIGREFHTSPSVPHFGEAGTGVLLEPGMTFTIEPMINLGTPLMYLLEDEWTLITQDRKLSAQFEHTLLVTEDGVEVLTQRQGVLRNSEDICL